MKRLLFILLLSVAATFAQDVPYPRPSQGGGGGGATFQVNGANTTSQSTISFQNGASTTVSNPSAGQVKIDFTGQLAQTMANVSHKWLTSYNATTGLFTQTQPDYSDLTNLPTLAATKTSTSNQWINSYDATTGLFTAAQPTLSNLGGGTAGSASFDFSGSSSFKVRVGAGLTTSANGAIGYDSTGNLWHTWRNGADEALPSLNVANVWNQAQTAPTYQTSGSNGGLQVTEGTGANVAAATGVCNLYGDSTAHVWKWNCNNGATSMLGGTESVPLLEIFGGSAWVQPSGATSTEFPGSSIVRKQKDISRYTKFRMIVSTNTAGATNAKFGLEYCTATCGTATNFHDLEASSGVTHQVSVAAAGSPIVGAWAPLDPAAQADVTFRVIGHDGDGVASVNLRSVMLELQ